MANQERITSMEYYSGLPFLVNSGSITTGTAAGQLNDRIENGPLAAGYPVGYAASEESSVHDEARDHPGCLPRFFKHANLYPAGNKNGVGAKQRSRKLPALANSAATGSSIKVATSGVASTDYPRYMVAI
jgi:hypothetical protein